MHKFLDVYLKTLNHGSRRTIKNRLAVFFRYLNDNKIIGLHVLCADDIMKWVNNLYERELKPATIYNYLSTVRHFLTYLHGQKFLCKNPWPEYLVTRYPQSPPRYVPGQDSTKAFLENIDKISVYPIRARAIFELCYGSGLRRIELRNLNVSDIRGDTLRVRGKGGRERLVPLGREAGRWLFKYIHTERLYVIKKKNALENALFLSRRGTRLYDSTFNIILRSLLKNRGPKARFTLHSLRHACATHMLENGASIAVLQKLLGHNQLSTTQIYTRVDAAALKKAHEKYHPRG